MNDAYDVDVEFPLDEWARVARKADILVWLRGRKITYLVHSYRSHAAHDTQLQTYRLYDSGQALLFKLTWGGQ